MCISYFIDPNRFTDYLSLKIALEQADSAISVKNSGRIPIEATEKTNQQPLLDSLKALPIDVFGKDATGYLSVYVRLSLYPSVQSMKQ